VKVALADKEGRELAERGNTLEREDAGFQRGEATLVSKEWDAPGFKNKISFQQIFKKKLK